MFQILFNVLMMLAMSLVIAQEQSRICLDHSYIQSLEGPQMLNVLTNCLMDGIVLRFKYPNKPGPFYGPALTHVEWSDCTFTALKTSTSRDRGRVLFNCLVRGVPGMDMSSASADTITERVRNNADQMVQSADDFARENCTDDITQNVNADNIEEHQDCFSFQILKHMSTAHGIMNQTGGFDDDEVGLVADVTSEAPLHQI